MNVSSNCVGLSLLNGIQTGLIKGRSRIATRRDAQNSPTAAECIRVSKVLHYFPHFAHKAMRTRLTRRRRSSTFFLLLIRRRGYWE